MIAVKKMQGLFWLLLVTLGAIAVYMVSLKVATERNMVHRLEAQIRTAKQDIRYLETEFGARASMRQLEAWNAEDYRYSAPGASQYLAGERALAGLDGIQPNGTAYVAPPVMTAMVETIADTPAVAAAATASPAVAEIRTDLSIIRTANAAEIKVPVAKPAASIQPTRTVLPKAAPDAVARKAERMAMLDEQLLDDRTFADIESKARMEGKRR